MLSIALTLLSICGVSLGSKRLLQQAVPFIPGAPGAPAPQPEFIPIPVDPLPGLPGLPVEPVPVEPVVPVVPVVPTIPIATEPAVPAVPIATEPAVPIPPPPVIVAPVQLQKNCYLPYTDPNSCAGQIDVIADPGQNFMITCAGIGACYQSQITLAYLKPTAVYSVESIIFNGAWSGYGATVTIDNQRGGNKIIIERLECNTPTACNGLTIVLNNGHLNDLECSEESDCANCWIKLYPTDPAPKACFGW